MDKEYLKTLRDEAEKMGLRQLAKKTVSRQSLYSLFRGKDVRLSTLREVSETLGYQVHVQLRPAPNKPGSSVRAALRKFGAPLFDTQVSSLTLEQTLALALKSAREDKVAADVLPYVLALNAGELDAFRLLTQLNDAREAQLLGYFSEVANRFLPNMKLELLTYLLFREDFTELNLASSRPMGKFTVQLLERVKNPAARKWKVVTMSSERDLLDRYEKWQRPNTQDNR